MRSLETPIERKQTMIIESKDTAQELGSGTLEVFATPRLIAFMENTAMNLVAEYLESGQGTVGTKVDIQHIAATPVGMEITATAKLLEVDNRRLVFELEAYDEKDKIAFGTHERFVIDEEKFLSKVNAKKS